MQLAAPHLPRSGLSLAVSLILLTGIIGLGSAGAFGFQFAVGPTDPVHLLRPATAHSAAEVEVFLNGTSDLSWQPDEVEVPSGAQVVFVLGIVGDLAHNFTMDSISNDTNLTTSLSPTQVVSYFAAHPPLVRVLTMNVSAPPTVSTPVTMPAHGVFEWICEVPGHFQAGMLGHLYDGIAEAPAPSSTITLNYIEIDVLALSTIAVVVVITLFVIYRNRGPKPPETDEDEEDQEEEEDLPAAEVPP